MSLFYAEKSTRSKHPQGGAVCGFSSSAAVYSAGFLACTELFGFDGIARGEKSLHFSAVSVLHFSQGGQYLDLLILLESYSRCVLLF